MTRRTHALTLLSLLAPLWLFAGVVAGLNHSLLDRMAITLLINLTLVLGLQTYMGNSGILSFAHIGFMGIGAGMDEAESAQLLAKLAKLPQEKGLGMIIIDHDMRCVFRKPRQSSPPLPCWS